MRYRWLALFAALTVAFAAPARPTAAVGDTRCFSETNFCIQSSFRQYWEQNGGLRIFGLPISDQFTLTFQGKLLTAQYFERARFESYPGDASLPTVLLGRVGDEALSRSGVDWRSFASTYDRKRADCQVFSQTNHAACGAFQLYFEQNGGVELFGLPLSDEMPMTLSDGRTITIQWFERARMEYNGANDPEYRVQLGLLGRTLLGR